MYNPLGSKEVGMKTFEEIYESLPGNGWLTENEARLLLKAASTSKGPILEVGCYYGRSTVLLASLDRPIYCVDPFSNFDSDDPSGNKILAAFTENLRSRNIKVSLERCRIEEWLVKPVGFAYLDGDHTYDGTRGQIYAAMAARANVIAIHDILSPLVMDASIHILGMPNETVERLGIWKLS